MEKREFKDVMDTYQATWPKTKLNDKTLDAWFPSMSEFTAIHAYQAIDRLAQDQDLMPMLSQFRRTALMVRNELDDTEKKADPRFDPANYPTSPYLKAAKQLIGGGTPGRYLLMTPVAELDVEGAGLKAKILDVGTHHQQLMASGRIPDANMLVEVSNLGSAVEMWFKPREAQIREKTQRGKAALEARRQVSVGQAPAKGSKR